MTGAAWSSWASKPGVGGALKPLSSSGSQGTQGSSCVATVRISCLAWPVEADVGGVMRSCICQFCGVQIVGHSGHRGGSASSRGPLPDVRLASECFQSGTVFFHASIRFPAESHKKKSRDRFEQKWLLALNIASVRNCHQIHTLFLNFFQQANVAGAVKLSK